MLRMCKEHKKININIEDVKLTIELTSHAEYRLKQRRIDTFQAIGIILSLGKKRIKQYNNSNKDIFIMDKKLNLSIVFAIENNNITIITVIHKADCYIKEGTIAVNL